MSVSLTIANFAQAWYHEVTRCRSQVDSEEGDGPIGRQFPLERAPTWCPLFPLDQFVDKQPNAQYHRLKGQNVCFFGVSR